MNCNKLNFNVNRKGQLKFPYNGENKKQAIVDFMRNPNDQVHQKKETVDEGWSDDTDVVHLTGMLTRIQKLCMLINVVTLSYCGNLCHSWEECQGTDLKYKSEEFCTLLFYFLARDKRFSRRDRQILESLCCFLSFWHCLYAVRYLGF